MSLTPLTAKQRVFVDAYLVDLNATTAAIAAGYPAKNARIIGSQNLSKLNIKAAIDAAMRERAAKLGVSGDKVIQQLGHLAFADIRKAVSWKDGVVSLTDSDKLDVATAAAIHSVTQGKDGEIKIRFHAKESALVNLGKHLGLFRDGENDRNAPITVNIIDPRSSAKATK